MLVTIDFESYYDEDFTLKKLSTSEYIRDPRFRIISCGVKVDDQPTAMYWGQAEIQAAFDALDWDQVELLGHHTHFDGLVLSHHFGKIPKVYRDTLSMARALFPKARKNNLATLTERLGVQNKLPMPDFEGKKLEELTPEEREAVAVYNIGDVESCLAAYRKMLPDIPPEELDLIDITVRMFAAPVLQLDVPRAEAALAAAEAARAKAIEKCGLSEKDLGSAKKVGDALEALGVPPPMKPSPKQKNPDGSPKWVYAFAQTDLEFTALINHPDPVVAALVEARQEVKSTINLTRPKRLLRAGRDHRLPVYLNYCGAHTTRWSGGDKLNFQNFPRGGELRKCLLAPPGQVIVIVDSAQIEVRVLAWLAGERWLQDEFAKKGGDPYCAFGTRAYGRVITKADAERQLSKVCVLGLGYGMGAFKLQQTFAWGTYAPPINLPMEVCEGFVSTYRQTSQAVKALWDLLNDLVGDMAKGREGEYKCLSWGKDVVHLPNGMDLHYPGTEAVVQIKRLGGLLGGGARREIVLNGSYESYGGGRSKLYGGLMTENMVQALARVIVAEQMRQIAKRYRVVMMSHDEVVYLAPAAEAEEAYQFGLKIMSVPPAWAPEMVLSADGGYDEHYSK